MARNLKKNVASEPRTAGVRMPPQNIEAEVAVLGSLMLDQQAIIQIADFLAAEDFYRPVHRKIYEAMLDLYGRREPLDVLSVSARLNEIGVLDEVGGRSFLMEMVNSVPTASNVVHYANIVHKKAVLRNLIDSSHYISQLGYKEDEDLDSLIDEAESRIFSIAEKSLHQKFIPVKSALEEAWNRIDKLHKGKGELRGVPTGFKEIDNILSGLQESDLVILAARPSVGKTSLALDIVRNVAVGTNIPVGVFSLEMSVQQLTDKLIAAESRVSLYNLRTGRLSNDDDFTRMQDALDKLSKAPIYIDDEGSNTILQMRTMARRLQAEHGLGLIVIDYLQLMRGQYRSADINRVQEVSEISRSLKQLAKELKVPVLALSQLSRAVEQRDGRPRLSDLRDSGSIEQDADVVVFISRDKRNAERPNQADIEIAKHRNGPTGQIALYFNQELASFTSLEKRADFAGFD